MILLHILTYLHEVEARSFSVQSWELRLREWVKFKGKYWMKNGKANLEQRKGTLDGFIVLVRFGS